jgi:multiple sugar transport system substrate-binding protein
MRLLLLALLLPILSGSGFDTQVGLAAQGEEPVTLNLWFFEGEEQLLPALEEAFETAHPTINLEMTLIPEDQYVVKLDTAMAAGSPPDLGFLYEPRWVKAGKILPLDDMIAAHEINLEDFNQAIIQGQCTIDGHVYCLGSYTGAVVLLYNKAMFDAAGLEYPPATEPMSIDEYAALAEKLSVPNEDVTKRVWGGSAEAPYWWTDTATMFSEDGKQVLGFVNDDATKHMYEVLGNMIAQGYSPSGSIMQSMGTQGSEDLFRQGKLAMSIGDFSQISALDEADIDYGVATLPVEHAGDPPHLSVWTDGLAVFSDSAHPAEAQEFLAFLATEGQRLRVEVTGEPPLSAAAAAEYGWVDLGNTEARKQFLEATQVSGSNFFVPGFWDVVAPLDDAFNQIAGGEITAAEALDAAAPRMQDRLDQAWETWEQFAQ